MKYFNNNKRFVLIAFLVLVSTLLLYMISMSATRDLHVPKGTSGSNSSNDIDSILLSHYYYKHYNLARRPKKKRVNLIVLVSSGPHRFKRRMVIRKTWWKQCRSNAKVTAECIFMTDKQFKGDQYYKVITKEYAEFKDLHLQDLRRPEFGVRYLYHLVYLTLNYDFDYLLRADDDYFLCLEKLLFELPMPPVNSFHWGWVHKENATRRSDEAINIFSKDLVLTILNQPNIRCHVFSGQMIRVWFDDLKYTTIYRHDNRLLHLGLQHKSILKNNICNKYIGMHFVYESNMQLLWTLQQQDHKNIHYVGSLLTHSKLVESIGTFCWSCINNPWRFHPQLCSKEMQWDIASFFGKTKYYKGNQNS